MKTTIHSGWIILIAAIAACGSPKSNPEFEQIVEDGRMGEAVTWLNAHPEEEVDPLSLLKVGQRFNEITEFDMAQPVLKRLLKTDPENIPGRLLLANNYREKSMFNEALAIYNELSKIDSIRFIVLPERARLFIRLEELDKASIDIGQARNLQSKYFAVYLADGLLWYAKGDMERALDLFEIAEELDPGVSAEASLYAGIVLQHSNVNYDAIQKYSRAIQVGKHIDKGYAFINRGICQLNLLDTTFACNDWDSAMAYMPDKSRELLIQYCGKFKKDLISSLPE